MKIMKRKTQKAIRKSVKKIIKKHGSKFAAGLAGSIASTLATLAGTEAPNSKGRKSNLANLSEKASAALTGDGNGPRKRAGSGKNAEGQKGKRGRKKERDIEQLEGSV